MRHRTVINYEAEYSATHEIHIIIHQHYEDLDTAIPQRIADATGQTVYAHVAGTHTTHPYDPDPDLYERPISQFAGRHHDDCHCGLRVFNRRGEPQ